MERKRLNSFYFTSAEQKRGWRAPPDKSWSETACFEEKRCNDQVCVCVYIKEKKAVIHKENICATATKCAPIVDVRVRMCIQRSAEASPYSCCHRRNRTEEIRGEKKTPSKKKKEKNGDEERGVKVCERGVATREQCSHHTQAAGESRFR